MHVTLPPQAKSMSSERSIGMTITRRIRIDRPPSLHRKRGPTPNHLQTGTTRLSLHSILAHHEQTVCPSNSGPSGITTPLPSHLPPGDGDGHIPIVSPPSALPPDDVRRLDDITTRPGLSSEVSIPSSSSSSPSPASSPLARPSTRSFLLDEVLAAALVAAVVVAVGSLVVVVVVAVLVVAVARADDDVCPFPCCAAVLATSLVPAAAAAADAVAPPLASITTDGKPKTGTNI